MIIGLDNVEIAGIDKTVDLSNHKPKDEKYVTAVDHRIDLLITNDIQIAQYFSDNGITALVKV